MRLLITLSIIFAAFTCFCSKVTAQSTTRGNVYPSASPAVVEQPTYTQQPVYVEQPMTQVQGSTTRSQVVQPYQGSVQGAASGYAPAGNTVAAGRPPVETFDSKLWNYLVRAKYRNWAPVPGQSDGAYEGQSPHGAYLKMYLNRKAAGDIESLRNGSIIIKENFTPQKSLAAITVMYKTANYNSQAGDWYWVKYNPDGSVATKSTDVKTVRLSGRVQGCINCHGDAAGGDFAFFNDPE